MSSEWPQHSHSKGREMTPPAHLPFKPIIKVWPQASPGGAGKQGCFPGRQSPRMRAGSCGRHSARKGESGSSTVFKTLEPFSLRTAWMLGMQVPRGLKFCKALFASNIALGTSTISKMKQTEIGEAVDCHRMTYLSLWEE